jgi:hypothetical protein
MKLKIKKGTKLTGTFSTKYGDVIDGMVFPKGSIKTMKKIKW